MRKGIKENVEPGATKTWKERKHVLGEIRGKMKEKFQDLLSDKKNGLNFILKRKGP
jgi:hypothetical protein